MEKNEPKFIHNQRYLSAEEQALRRCFYYLDKPKYRNTKLYGELLRKMKEVQEEKESKGAVSYWTKKINQYEKRTAIK